MPSGLLLLAAEALGAEAVEVVTEGATVVWIVTLEAVSELDVEVTAMGTKLVEKPVRAPLGLVLTTEPESVGEGASTVVIVVVVVIVVNAVVVGPTEGVAVPGDGVGFTVLVHFVCFVCFACFVCFVRWWCLPLLVEISDIPLYKPLPGTGEPKTGAAKATAKTIWRIFMITQALGSSCKGV